MLGNFLSAKKYLVQIMSITLIFGSIGWLPEFSVIYRMENTSRINRKQ